MNAGFFVTGTDTGVGKTLIACAMLRASAARGQRVAGMKPVAAGAENGRWDDVELLLEASTVRAPRDIVNPYAFGPAIAPHIAADLSGVRIDLDVIGRAYAALAAAADVVIVEGCGGFLVPLNAKEGGAELVQRLALPVVLVVGMRLGCLNHALLTLQAISASGSSCAGWVANCIDPLMSRLAENIQTLTERLPCPLCGTVPFLQEPTAANVTPYLDLARLP